MGDEKSEEDKDKLCGNCKCCVDIADKDVLQCEGRCEKTFHKKCTYLSEAEFKIIIKVKNTLWFCKKCFISAKKSQPLNVNMDIKKAIEELNIKMNYMADEIKDLKSCQQERGQREVDLAEEKSVRQIFKSHDSSKKSDEDVWTIVGNKKRLRKLHGEEDAAKKGFQEEVVFLKPKTETSKLKDAVKEVKENVDPQKLGIGVTKIKKMRDGGVVIGCDNVVSLESLMKVATEKMGEDYEIVQPEVKTRMKLKIIGVLNEEIVEDNLKFAGILCEQNEAEEIKIVNEKINFSGRTSNIIIEVDLKSGERMLSEERIKVGWSMCKVVEHFTIIRCYRCNGYGHFANNCKNKQSCSKCGDEHKYDICKSEIMCCVNCTKANARYGTSMDVNHAATDSRICKYFKRIDSQVRINKNSNKK